MNERRNFLKRTVLLAGLALTTSRQVFASDASLPSNIVYTRSDPGKWEIYATSFCNLHDFWVTEYTF